MEYAIGKKKDDDQNEIFSDRQSKSHYYKRFMGYSFWFGMIVSDLFFYGTTGIRDYIMKVFGVWKNALFWKAFIFETPFVLLKLFPAFMVVLLAGSYYKAYRKYSVLKEQ